MPWYIEETGHEQAFAFPLPLWERVPRQGQVRGRINIDTENVGANEKLFNHAVVNCFFHWIPAHQFESHPLTFVMRRA
ncbi:hypothetical protein AGMMS50256_27320 [Betaproteobacteria bacterium]|nr:hypothetical protein AGMMS50256_27320 [Betaproteobacteria bacterium]